MGNPIIPHPERVSEKAWHAFRVQQHFGALLPVSALLLRPPATICQLQAEIYFGGSAAAITSFLTLGMTINSKAAFGFAASSSLDNWASRHWVVATVPVDR